MSGPGTPCEWCRSKIPAGRRRDTKTCSKPCRQAKARFNVHVSQGSRLGPSDRPMRFCYADPPYPGMSHKYKGHDDYGGEVDHEELVHNLLRDFPAGWALSTSARATRDILGLYPEETRLCIFVNGPRVVESWEPLRAYETVLLYGGRRRAEPVVEDLSDVLVWGGRQPSHPGALEGMKPAIFADWVFRLLGAHQGDELVDLFPGSGAIGRAWDIFQSRVD